MKHCYQLLLLFAVLSGYAQNSKEYDLYVTDTVVNYTGKKVKAIAINGSIPAPTLHFTEGDTAVIRVHNKMHHETSIHWHGLLLPNEQDGVPYLTTAPIKGMSTHTYKFPIKQSGTYWYHSHTMLQEQIGMYGAFIIHKKQEPELPEYTMLLSDWTDANPHEIERSLHKANDWYAIKKGATQNYAEAIGKGHFLTKFTNEWKRMHAMDVSDVYYEHFFVNGKQEDHAPQFKPGEKVRVRIINGSASTYFWLNYAGGKITVVASDGMDVQPVAVDRFIVGVSETYDVIVTIPDKDTAFELVATAEDRTGQASLWLGNGVKQLQQPLPKLKYFEGMKMMNDMMTVGGNMKDMGMNMSLQQMDMNTVMYPEITGKEKDKKTASMAMEGHHHQETGNTDIVTLNYAMLKSPVKTNLPDGPVRTLHFELTGNMNRYVWTLNNKTISESDKVLIKKGENIRIVVTNNSMMRHPMHLHGHFFRILNGQGDYAPLKNVLDIMPMETDTIEFHASEEYGNWYFHCHILYHMMAGMGRIFTYENSPPNPQIPDPEMALKMVYNDDRRYYFSAEVGLESNGSDGEMRLENTRNFFDVEWRLGFNKNTGYETEAHFGRYLDKNQYLSVYTGFDFRYHNSLEREENLFGQASTQNQRAVACIGLIYQLPWLINADVRLDHEGKARLQFVRKDIPVTERVRLWGSWNTDFEYSVGSRYILTKYWSLSAHYDSDMGMGGGIVLTY
ncbi:MULTISPECIES: multicopper oxidase domain-containing protein [unclassified Flavobacterium]|uniref:multicopper oxidase domain-containing protein n=1 Tax=unclassified Flavobacterium TaxID=196869 RepID=UPI000868C677|nr:MULTISPECIES: multicopper oxidase domain-containing protein [unclassified Flavobacterium]MBN9285983.1 multicopper oxidase domain-containing protein [Flavobacterium sp.]ODS84790.1 MAG: copper oxidase [Chryseobacterium sp. SCN 40-13]OJV68275.1 MAG: copper oxidase [Flavobacterium sp. 40-81]